MSLYIDGSLNETNSSGVNGTYIFPKTFSDGNYNWSIKAYDNESNTETSDTRDFTVDTINPSVEGSLNETTLYAEGDVVELTYTITNTNLDKCWYEYNGTNNTITCGSGLTEDITTTLDDLNITVYGNDTAGNQNSTTLSMVLDSDSPNITISSPSGNIAYGGLGDTINLNTTVTDSQNLDSCWYNYNGTNQTFSCSSGVKVTEIFELEDYGTNHNLTVYANDSVGNLDSEITTWDYDIFQTSRDFTSNIYETSNQDYSLNITTVPEVLSVTAKLNYNGSDYVSSVDCDSGDCEIKNNIDVPLVTSGESENKTFFWTITVFDGTSQSSSNTTSYNQNVTKIHLEKCDGTYTNNSVNFTAYSEGNLTSIDPFSMEGTFDYWLGGGDVKQTTSIDESDVSSVSLCIKPDNRTFITNAQIDYFKEGGGTNYVDRKYYFDKKSLDYNEEAIYLYLLKTDSSTTFIQQVEDQQTESIAEAFIYTKKYYEEDGKFRTVQISKTDDNGKTNGFYQTETVDYKHTITKDQEVVLDTNRGTIVGEEIPFTLIFRIGGSTEYPWKVLEENENVKVSLGFNKDTNIVTYSWIDDSSVISKGILKVYKTKYSSENTLVCNKTASFTSGTLICDVSNYTGKFEAYGYIVDGEKELGKLINFAIKTGKDVFGNTGLIIGVFIILTASLSFIWNPTALIVSLNLSTIAVNLIGFIDFGSTYIFAMVGVSILAIIFLKT